MRQTIGRDLPRNRLVGLPCVILSGLLAVAGLSAQPREDHSHFEVASIRPVELGSYNCTTGPGSGDLARVICPRLSLRDIIAAAYPEYEMRISGPAAIDNSYSLSAKLPPGSKIEDLAKMQRNLLTERFGLKFHDEYKDAPGFELIVGEKGFRLTPATIEESPPAASNPGVRANPQKDDRNRDGFPILTAQDRWRSLPDRDQGVVRTSAHQCSMNCLANMLSNVYTKNAVPVVDKTEIKGLFDIRLVLVLPSFTILPPQIAAQFPPQRLPPDLTIDLRDTSGLLEKQTGLKLKPVKVPIHTLVVDSVARTPTEN